LAWQWSQVPADPFRSPNGLPAPPVRLPPEKRQESPSSGNRRAAEVQKFLCEHKEETCAAVLPSRGLIAFPLPGAGPRLECCSLYFLVHQLRRLKILPAPPCLSRATQSPSPPTRGSSSKRFGPSWRNIAMSATRPRRKNCAAAFVWTTAPACSKAGIQAQQ